MIRIVVDSSADFSKEERESKNLTLIPLQVNINEKNYHDGVDLFSDDFYELLSSSNSFPKTSQPSPQDFVEQFEDAKANGDTLICILISSALSGTYQSAVLAKSMVEYDNIYLIDSLTATIGIRVLVNETEKLITEGKSVEDIVVHLEEMKHHIIILAAVDTLEYLCKGGRVSKTVATIGEMANIKPLITVNQEGKVEVIGKRPGVTRALVSLMKKMEEHDMDNDYPLYSLFSYGSENCNRMEEKLKNKGYDITKRLQIGPTIGTHIGPEAFGICFVEKW